MDTHAPEHPPAFPGSEPHPAASRPVLVWNGVVCRSCGYDLFGLSIETVCPECGTAVRHSLRDDSLVFSDPAWLARVGRGAAVVLWTTLAWIGLSVAGRFLVAVLTAGSGPLSVLFEAVVLSLVLVDSALFVLGAWWLTARELNGPAQRPTRARYAARALITLGVAVHNARPLLSGVALGVAPGMIGWIGVGLAAAGWAALLFHVRTLARRTGATGLASSANFVAWFLTVVMLGAVAIWLCALLLLLALPGASPVGILVGALGCWGMLAIPAAWLCAVVVIAQFANRIEWTQARAVVIREQGARRVSDP